MEDKERFQELQIIEQSIQNILLQKQAYQMELSETKAALEELNSSGEEVYKMIGQLMLKTNKEKMKSEILSKEKLIELRISSLEKQEKNLSEQLQALRDEILSKKK